MAFVKGQSGNPGGRSREYVDVIEYARKKSKGNIDRIAKLADHAEDENVRLRAAHILHEIAWGKPVQPIAGTGDGGAIIVKWAAA